MKNMISQMLQTTQYALDAIAKKPRPKQKTLVKATDAVINYFVERLRSGGIEEEETQFIFRASEQVLKVTIQTGVCDMVILDKMYWLKQIDAYEKFCRLSTKARKDQCVADILAKIDPDTMSANRMYYILDRYGKSTPVPDQMFDPAYDDEQVKVMWRSHNAYLTCLARDFDPMSLITSEATPSAISAIITTAADMVIYDRNPIVWLSFPKEGNFEKHKFGHVIAFIAKQNMENPITCNWRNVIPHDLTTTVIAELNDEISKLPGEENRKKRADKAQQVLDKWNGFTESLQHYYENRKHKWGHASIYAAWQNDLRDNYVTGDALAALLLSKG